MYLLAKFGGHRSYRNVNSYVNSYMDTLENPALITTIRHIARFLKSEIPIYNSEVPNKDGRRTQAIAKRFAFHANPKIQIVWFLLNLSQRKSAT